MRPLQLVLIVISSTAAALALLSPRLLETAGVPAPWQLPGAVVLFAVWVGIEVLEAWKIGPFRR